MRDLWARIRTEYVSIQNVTTTTCNCLQDVENNGIQARLLWIAQEYTHNTPISLHEWGTKIPELSLATWPGMLPSWNHVAGYLECWWRSARQSGRRDFHITTTRRVPRMPRSTSSALWMESKAFEWNLKLSYLTVGLRDCVWDDETREQRSRWWLEYNPKQTQDTSAKDFSHVHKKSKLRDSISKIV